MLSLLISLKHIKLEYNVLQCNVKQVKHPKLVQNKCQYTRKTEDKEVIRINANDNQIIHSFTILETYEYEFMILKEMDIIYVSFLNIDNLINTST